MRSTTAFGTVAALCLLLVIAAPASPSKAADCDPSVFNSDFVSELAADHPGRSFSAEVFDIRTGCAYSLNPALVLTTASVLKIEILAGVLLDAQDENRNLTDRERDRVVAMITASANTEASELRTSIGAVTRMRQLDDLFGMDDTTAVDPWGLTRTTAADQVELLRRTFLNIDGLFTDYSLGVFEDTMSKVIASQQWGISSGVPSRWYLRSRTASTPRLDGGGASTPRVSSSTSPMPPPT